jgi:hypothetical protein
MIFKVFFKCLKCKLRPVSVETLPQKLFHRTLWSQEHYWSFSGGVMVLSGFLRTEEGNPAK